MKRELTFELKSIHPDYNVAVPKVLEKKIGKAFKLIGDIIVGKSLEMYFEDGYVFKTAPLDLGGYIYKLDDDDKVIFVTLCTKDMAFELDVIQKKIKVKLEEQLKLV